jgi:hypothetical protein
MQEYLQKLQKNLSDNYLRGLLKTHLFSKRM